MFVIIVVLLLCGWGVTVAVTWSGFRPQRVDVTGTAQVDPNTVRAAARIPLNGNIWLLNPWALASRVDAVPYILSVDLRRSLPNHVTLAVHERKPDSCLLTHAGKVTIDVTDRVLENGCRRSMSYLLPAIKTVRVGSTITDASLARLRNDVGLMTAQHIAVQSAHFDRDDGLVIVTRDAVTLLLGEDATLSQTGALLNPIFDAVKKQGRSISQVDLRAASTPVVRYKDSPGKTQKASGAE